MTDIRRFKCNTHLVLPTILTPIDGLPNMRFEPGQTFDVDAKRCETAQRYLSGRLRAKDLEEVAYVAPAPDTAPAAPESAPVAEPAPAVAPDHVPITQMSAAPKASDPAFTFTASLPKEGDK